MKNILFIFVTFFLINHSLYAFQLKRRNNVHSLYTSSSLTRIKTKEVKPSTGIASSSLTSIEGSSSSSSLYEQTKKWAFKTTKTTSEVLLSDAKDQNEFIRDLMRGILMTSRILDIEDNLKNDVTLVIALPYLTIDSKTSHEFISIANELLLMIHKYGKVMFPIEIHRTINIQETNIMSDEGPTPCYMLTLTNQKITLHQSNFDDMNEIPKDFEDIYDNNIPSFPFPSVYDFISEINRPPDPATMSNLRFNFQIQDFRGDIKKASKKKNPQEILDGINCKLTRLQNWKDVLLEHTEDTKSPFVEIYGWSEDMKSKYRSLKYLASIDPKKAMDTQYDKRKVFIQIIDQWSDRLKRYFKYIYHSSREEIDAQEQAHNTLLRLEMKSLTKMHSIIPYLDFNGPEFQPGKPKMLKTMEDDRASLTSINFSFDSIIIDIIRWIDRINEIQQYTFNNSKVKNNSLSLPSRFIHMHSYSRGYSTERLMRDVWISLIKWINKSSNNESFQINKTSLQNLNKIKIHHNDFINTIIKINKISRKESVEQAKGIKELYNQWSNISPEFIDWFCELVGDLNIEDQLEQMLLENPKILWINIIDKIINGEFSDGEQFSSNNSEMWIKNREIWKKFRPILEKAEILKKSISWSTSETQHLEQYISILHDIKNKIDLTKDLITFDVSTNDNEKVTSEDAMIFIMPRMYRGIGDTELGNFMEFCKLILEQVQYFHLENEMKLKLIPLHPEMVNQKGIPDFSRRSPHPAILFFLSDK